MVQGCGDHRVVGAVVDPPPEGRKMRNGRRGRVHRPRGTEDPEMGAPAKVPIGQGLDGDLRPDTERVAECDGDNGSSPQLTFRVIGAPVHFGL